MRVLLSNIYFLFAFTALVFEPLYYFPCDWNDVNESCGDYIIARIWRIYTQWDPIFADIPLFLRIMCWIECFIFGPSYFFCAYYIRKEPAFRPNVFNAFTYVFSGALVYSTVVYFLYELIHEMERINVGMVLLVNSPWTFVPMILCGHLHFSEFEARKNVKHTKKSR